MKFPDFIIIGAAKCGTTALWYNLDKHPDITMATKSTSSIEMNFWGGPPFKKGIDWYKSRCKGKFSGEKSTLYYFHKKSMRQIYKNMPNVKMILCVRNPVDRAYSNWQMNNISGKVSSPFSLDLFEKRYANPGKYYNHIKNHVLNFFSRDQLHIYISEWGKKDPTTEMNKVFDFLDVHHLNLPKKEINGRLLKNRSRQEDVRKNRKEKFYRVWSKQPQILGEPLRSECLKFFEPFNKKLFEYLGYEIKEWKK